MTNERPRIHRQRQPNIRDGASPLNSPDLRGAAATLATRAQGRLITSDGVRGTPCTTGSQCASRMCKDGVCCTSACTGTCQTCSSTPGICASTINAEDPDTCTGNSSCGATGLCKLKDGQPCTTGTQCLTNYCVHRRMRGLPIAIITRAR